MRSRCIFISCNLYKTRSHRKNTFPLLLVGLQFVKTRSRHKLLIYFPFDRLNNWCKCLVPCVSILKRPTGIKKIWNWPKKLLFTWWSISLCWNHFPIAFGIITICQNTYPSLLSLFCDGNVFWQIENAGNAGKRPLKPLNSLNTMPRAWTMAALIASPISEHFWGALVDFA